MRRLIYCIAAYFFVGLAFIGVFVPGLPTVPFLLLAAWLATRGSERLHAWLYAHRAFGPMLTDWDENRAVARKSKVMAIVMLMVSWALLFAMATKPWVLAFVSCIFVTVAIFLITRPEPN